MCRAGSGCRRTNSAALTPGRTDAPCAAADDGFPFDATTNQELAASAASRSRPVAYFHRPADSATVLHDAVFFWELSTDSRCTRTNQTHEFHMSSYCFG